MEPGRLRGLRKHSPELQHAGGHCRAKALGYGYKARLRGLPGDVLFTSKLDIPAAGFSL
jgi:hypothetical protein